MSMLRKILLLAAVTALFGLAPTAGWSAGGFKARGFFLPDGAVKVDEDRFRLPQAWDDALKWYRSTYPPAKFPRRGLRNQSGVRALHIANTTAGEWQGANIYEMSGGEVRVYILARPEKPPEKPEAKPETKPPAPTPRR
jgi:hypothetical protein